MNKKTILLILPIILITSTAMVFHFATQFSSSELGYLIGFLFYWLFWCLLVPFLLERQNFKNLFKDKYVLFQKKNWWLILLLTSTIIAPIFMYFLPSLSSTPLPIIILAIPLALIHAFFEETFWRGLYTANFPNNFFFSVLFPTLFFSLWHFSPQFAIPTAHPINFIISTLPLGLIYALVAYVTKSAKWSIIAHGISGILAFSGLLASSVYALFF